MQAKIFKSLYLQVIIAVVIGIAFGHFFPSQGAALKPLGDAFVKLVKMMISPVVFCTIAIGIASLGDKSQLGRILGKTLGLFLVLTLLALGFGLAAVNVIRPGAGMNIDPSQLDTSGIAKYTHSAKGLNAVDFFMHMIPDSFVGAFTQGEVLPVLLLAVLTGFALSAASGKGGDRLLAWLEDMSQILFRVFNFVMKVAPIGAFGAMAFTVGKYGVHSLASLGQLILTFYVACIGFVVVVLGGLCRLSGFSLWRTLKYFREELLVVLGTSSTEPVLPRVLQKLEKLGCSKGVAGFVLPTGYSFNLAGTAIYLSLASLFIAQACNIDLSWQQTAIMLGIMLLSSKGAAGVTGSGFVALAATLVVVHDIPLAGIALLLGIDRFMSEARALTSIISNIVCSLVVALWEKACDREQLLAELCEPSPLVEAVAEEAEPQLEGFTVAEGLSLKS
ncbi:sodium:dicarboxylate symporter [Pseudogulbenkiania sp. NH8B]|uniref:Sodium:dicarboxylate symporter n=1 Tax=Pseudogulbenkiania ferrooxidans 2002 TaxID=279714 RepID=B9Z5A6_9NEIS|nr:MULTISPECIES: C4-dicarboxylate transporter DctA [Pseudogulbenkiania]EEG08338.1 sodium:dicarboxylate symporter [Pseudogulbenkiania ferrooxidans 2002]BAK77541.1 sodium:dicarboxylate symporter [Pseudogulbenkiania sp. NH8B]